MNKTKEIIKKCGGALVISEKLEITLDAVYKWRDRKSIPKKYGHVLIALAKSRGEIVKHEDFF